MDWKLGRLMIAAALAAAAGQDAHAGQMDIKGISIGDDEAAVASAMKSPDCSDKEMGRICFDRAVGTFGGKPAKLMIAHFVEGKIATVTVTLDEAHFSAVVNALVSKFGTPDSDTTQAIENRMGASFENRVVVWGAGDETITATQRVGDIDRSTVALNSAAAILRWSEEQEAKAKEMASDL